MTPAAQPISECAPTTVPNGVTETLRRMRAPILIAHVVPDADAIGSMLGLARASACNGCQPRVSLPPGSLSQKLSFLFERAEVKVATVKDFVAADGFVALDTAKKGRCNLDPAIKETDWSTGRPLINIDHHETNTRFGDVNWVVGHAGSTCELVYALLRTAELPIDPVTASLLYVGIQSDTLGFSLGTTRPEALEACADLVRCGADIADLGERLHRSLRKSEFDLLRVIYANTQVSADGRLAYSSASYDEIRESGCTAADIDDQISVPRSLQGVRLAMLFSEGNRGKTRINFRGSGEVTVVELAGRFKGGGHSQSAGAILDCGLRDAIERVVPLAAEHLEKFPR